MILSEIFISVPVQYSYVTVVRIYISFNKGVNLPLLWLRQESVEITAVVPESDVCCCKNYF
jgi:hypothetical protein